MSGSNIKSINSTSLLDLKAELLRKKQELQKEKVSGSTGRSKTLKKDKKSDIWSRSNAGVRERAQKDYEEKKEEDDVLAKSRKILEAKARAYDKMASGSAVTDDDANERFLVDFERKGIDKLIELKHQKEEQDGDYSGSGAGSSHSTKEKMTVQEHEEQDPESNNPEESWVDYVDSLGRSRRCAKEDLPMMKKIDEELTGKKSVAVDAVNTEESLPELMSDDMYREKLRQQWEAEEQRNMEQPDTHYANVQFNEVREHGVAYYQFNKDAEVRQEQMDSLTALRKQTKENRETQKKLKDKRKAMMAARLAKVRQRKMIREGKDPNDFVNQSESSEDSDDDVIGPKISEKTEDQETLTRDETWRRTAPVREWDKDKQDLPDFLAGRVVHTETSWKEKLRRERVDDFAPPSMYNENQGRGKRSTISQPPRKVAKIWKQAPDPMATLDTRSVPSAASNSPDVGSMLANIRAQVEETRRKLPEHVASVTGSDPRQGVDVGDIPLPSSVEIREESSEMEQVTNISKISQVIPLGIPKGVSHNTVRENPQVIPQGLVPEFPQEIPHSTVIPTSTTAHHLNLTAHHYDPGQTTETCTVGGSLSDSTAPQQYMHTWTTEVSTDTVNDTTVHRLPATTVSEVTLGPQPAHFSRLPPTTVYAPTLGPQPAHFSKLPPTTVSAPTLGPQPAHFSSGPMKPQVPTTRYERVNLHELPMELPAPPTAHNIPAYPSQEVVIGACSKTNEEKAVKRPFNEDQAIKQWQRQFYGPGKMESSSHKADKIPFKLPYVQSENKTEMSNDPASKFDPSKPPPDAQ